jgi:hypothetical protein
MKKRKKVAVIKKKKIKISNDDSNLIEDELRIKDDVELEPVHIEVEDDKEFITQIKDFEEKHKNHKLINVYKLIGKPSLKKAKKLSNVSLKNEYNNLVALLDKHNIIVHFQNDYPLTEKYRFITEEIFKEDIEDLKKYNLHANFIYEDFHPQLSDEDEVII